MNQKRIAGEDVIVITNMLLFVVGEVLDTAVIFPFGKNANAIQAKNKLVELVLKHR